jgi:hypothetical protein
VDYTIPKNKIFLELWLKLTRLGQNSDRIGLSARREEFIAANKEKLGFRRLVSDQKTL